MTHQQATSVVAAPIRTVESRVRDVLGWPRFMLGVEQVTEISFGRYRFVVRNGSRTRTVDVAVTAHPREHRIVWCALNGPRFDGELRLAEVDADHTRVRLTLRVEPLGLLAGLADMVSSSADAATIDLRRLDDLVA